MRWTRIKIISLVIFVTLFTVIAAPAYGVKEAQLFIDPKIIAPGERTTIWIRNSGNEPITITSITVTRPDGIVDTDKVFVVTAGSWVIMSYPDTWWSGSDGSEKGSTEGEGIYTVRVTFNPTIEDTFTVTSAHNGLNAFWLIITAIIMMTVGGGVLFEVRKKLAA